MKTRFDTGAATRRRAAGIPMCLAVLAVHVFLAGCVASRPAPRMPQQRFEYSEPHMGAPFRIVVYAEGASQAGAAARAAFDRVAELNGIFSDYETDSELNRLAQSSGSGREVAVSADLWCVLHRAQSLSRRTAGAFDVTVGPCVGLWRKARREQQLPDPERLRDALARTGYGLMVLHPRQRSVTLLEENMHLDLGGIAKGYALDEALRVLQSQGLPSALVSGGGDLVVGDPPPGRPGWRIEIGALDAPGAPRARAVLLSNAAVATSGDLFQRLEIGGVRYSHIVDPRTGVDLTDHSLVTVIARDGMTADSLATAVSVLGPALGIPLIEETRGAAGLIARRPGSDIEYFESRRMKSMPNALD